MSVAFLLTALVVVLVPGTGVIYTLAVALGRGRTASVSAAFGCTLGILPHISAAILGLAALLHASAVLFQTVKFVGVLYLLWMAWSALREEGLLRPEPEHAPMPHAAIIRRGFLINILNPKLSMFFLAFLPQFIPAGTASPTLSMAWLGLVFMAMTFVIFVGYGQMAALIRGRVLASGKAMKWIRRSFAAAFALVGVRLALSAR